MRGREAAPPLSLFSFQDILTSVTGIITLLMLVLAVELITRRQTSIAEQADQTFTEVQESLSQARSALQQFREALNPAAVQHLAAVSPAAALRQLHDDRLVLQQWQDELARVQARRKQLELLKNEQAQLIAAAGLQTELTSVNAQIDAEQDRLGKLRRSKRLIYNPARGERLRPWLLQAAASHALLAEGGTRGPPLRFEGTSPTAWLPAFRRWLAAHRSQDAYVVLLLRPSAVASYEDIEQAIQRAGLPMGLELIAEDQTVIDPETGAGL